MEDQFTRTRWLLGEEAVQKLAKARVAVFGIGGVGGYVCEALVRSGVGAFDLIDNDKGVFKPYMSKFFQSALSVVIQVSLAKLGVGLMMNMHIFWGVACMILAVRTPKFLQDFLITTGGGGSGAIVNNAYHSVRLVQMVKGMGK